MKVRTIVHEGEMAKVAEEILSTLSGKDSAHVIALQGELGAGKTTFVKALANMLGITEHVTSPTFVIMKSYRVEGHAWIEELVHIDAYRIENIDEVRILRLPELFKKAGRIVCIEWPEHIAESIPEDALKVHISIEDDTEREITYGS